MCSLEYGNEIWECTCNKGLADVLESIILGVLRRFWVSLELAIRGDMDLDTLRSRRNKLKWWYKFYGVYA